MHASGFLRFTAVVLRSWARQEPFFLRTTILKGDVPVANAAGCRW
jgi:hypothetical protein